jgi:GNAT superfamily N-acetyltransferase
LLFDHGEDNGRVHVHWSNTQLFVPPALEGAGFSSRLLDAVVERFRRRARDSDIDHELRVTIDDLPRRGKVQLGSGAPASHDEPRSQRLDPAHRQARMASLHFYKSRGFVQEKRSPAALEQCETVTLQLPAVRPAAMREDAGQDHAQRPRGVA